MNKIKGYRNMFDETQEDWAKLLNVSRATYNQKEKKIIPFSDSEKEILRNHIRKKIPNITIDELFF